MEYTHYCQIGCKECTDIGTKLCHYKQTERFKAKITRLKQENRELKAYKDVNEDFKKAWDELNKKYTEVLKLAKENADSNEYCLQELEKENKELEEKVKSRENELANMAEQANMRINTYRSTLEEIREIAENAKEGRYATKSEDYTEGMHTIGCYVLDRINEVLE